MLWAGLKSSMCAYCARPIVEAPPTSILLDTMRLCALCNLHFDMNLGKGQQLNLLFDYQPCIKTVSITPSTYKAVGYLGRKARHKP